MPIYLFWMNRLYALIWLMLFKHPSQRNVTTRMAESKMHSAWFDAFDPYDLHTFGFIYVLNGWLPEMCVSNAQDHTNTYHRIDAFDLICESSNQKLQTHEMTSYILSRFFCHSGSAPPWWRRCLTCVEFLLFEKREQQWMKVFDWKKTNVQKKIVFSLPYGMACVK